MAVVQGPSSGILTRVALTPLRTGRGDFITFQGYRRLPAVLTMRDGPGAFATFDAGLPDSARGPGVHHDPH